ncbi:SusC/RagA family TonB-linked outer membrane protein [Sinomicrobium pectinilyticum]|uniref:SusC/RagA family TonB-linked outer membrane protein n=1 Tax=Sinomicrobium pectinilyticum TaxID=1084421 RepID=UPI001F0CD9AB|nr:TonB-dependent receptor [Sinomicrobium pectinilyticum]
MQTNTAIAADYHEEGRNSAQLTVSGTVTDETGVPLLGVSVLEKGTQNGTTTDFEGNYSLQVSSSDAVLEFSYLGMKTVSRTVDNNATINVKMAEDNQSLDEVVVVGYGTQSRRSVTTSVAKVSAEDFNQGVVTSPLNLIQGKIPGLAITQPGGNNPNSSASFQIRGVTSVTGDRSPLIVIDGIPGGNLDLLQPNDIESFDILKDGAAAAIYGTRGNNGVILITTKTGKAGKTTFDYSTYLSRDFVRNRPEFLSASEYRGLIDRGIVSPNNDLGYSTDIYDELLDKSNLSQYHNFVASGGSENGNYRVSLYMSELDGIAKENSRKEYGFRASFNQSTADKKFHFQGSFTINLNDANLLGGGDFGLVSEWNPTAPIYAPYSVEQGTPLYNEGRYGYYQPQNGYNPFSQYENRINKRDQVTFSGDAKVSYEVIEGMTIAVFGSYQRNSWNDRYYRSTRDWSQYNEGSSYNGTAYARKGNHVSYTRTFEPTLNYTKSIDDHSFEMLGGYSYQYTTTEEYSMDNSGFTTDAFEDWNFGSGNAITDDSLPPINLGSLKDDNTLIAFFSRLNYSYLDRYFLQASIRYEGSSRFGVNNKWGSFPAVSAGWLISDEEFMENMDFLSNLKLRVGYGITGNQGIPNYRSMIILGTGGKYPVFDESGTPVYYQTYGPNRNPNPDLKWERKKEWNIGLDFGLLQNRITGSIDVYDRKTEDLLYDYAVSQPSYIHRNLYTNVGVLKNSGVELALSFAVMNKEDFSWNMDFVGNYQKNELASLSNDLYTAEEIRGGNIGNPGNLGDAIRNKEGQSIGNFYGKKFAGFTDNGEWLFYKADGSVGRTDEMTEEDNVVLGNGFPNFNASLSNTFKYKNFDLTLFFRGKFDYDILNTLDLFYGNPTLLPGNVLSSAVDNIGKITEAPQYSDYYLEKGDFVRLDNVTLGYNFKMGSNSPFSSLRLYVNARNVFTITGYSGQDPEVSDTGLYPGIEGIYDGSDGRKYYPRTTTLTTGINIQF